MTGGRTGGRLKISRLLRVAHDWDAAQLAWRPRVDAFGETSHRGLRVAGDAASIVGVARTAGSKRQLSSRAYVTKNL